MSLSRQGANEYKQIVEDALVNTAQRRSGTWKTLGECEFWISGDNVSIIKDGSWVTTFPLTKQGTIEYIMGLPIIE